MPGRQCRPIGPGCSQATSLADERVGSANEEIVIVRGQIGKGGSAAGDGIHLSGAGARLRVSKDDVAHIDDRIAGINR